VGGEANHQTKELGEWIEYLNYFREACWNNSLSVERDEDAVRLMTAHGAKGLEFPHVFVLRATKGSFPASYRETLVEFPAELRDPDSAAAGDDKTLHDQEERRLFYVAMTRAKDSLHIYGKQGIGRDKTPAGLMRELIGNAGLRPWLRSRPALPSQPELIEIAAAADRLSPGFPVAAWLALPAIEGLDARLSATAVETYETCPLQFKFEREWKLSRQLHAAMQYGAAMHRVLRTYYDSVRLGRTKNDDELLQLFRDDLATSGIQDDYQRDLYLKQGLEQLTDFLAANASSPRPRFCTRKNGLTFRSPEPRSRDESIAWTAWPMEASRSSTTRPARLARRRTRMRACSSPSTPWPHMRSGDTAWESWCFTIWKGTSPWFRSEPSFNWKKRETRAGCGARHCGRELQTEA
jgi:hypothetical protein